MFDCKGLLGEVLSSFCIYLRTRSNDSEFTGSTSTINEHDVFLTELM